MPSSFVPSRVIALVDCDSFFVSCERVDEPSLNGKPVCVVTSVDSRGVVVSRSKEAKAAGIQMGQPVFQFKSTHPHVICIGARHERYEEISQDVMAVLRKFTPDVEPVSVDEAYLDLTGMNKLYGMSYVALVKSIRQKVLEEAKVPVSIGLATSKTLAKLASDKAKKCGGIFAVAPSEIEHLIQTTELDEICGIGQRMLKQYKYEGIFDARDLMQKDPVWLKKKFGVNAYRLRLELEGVCVSAVDPVVTPPQSIQNSSALAEFTRSCDVLKQTLPHHVHKASQKLRKWNGFCGTFAVTLRSKDYKDFVLETKLPMPTNSEQTLLKQAHLLLEKLYNPQILYRSTGVWLKNLSFGEVLQPSLFSISKREDDKLSHVIDGLEEKFGKNIIKFGS